MNNQKQTLLSMLKGDQQDAEHMTRDVQHVARTERAVTPYNSFPYSARERMVTRAMLGLDIPEFFEFWPTSLCDKQDMTDRMF